MKLYQRYSAVFAGCAMLVMILDGRCALAGAAEGIALCIKTVIPALFPFLFVSSLLTFSLMGQPLPVLRPFARCLGIPEGAESLMIAGFLGGYPAGAQQIALHCRRGSLSRETAERLLGVCCNAGPSFLFGMIAPRFPKLWMAWALWGIHILSAFLTARILGNTSHGQAVLSCSSLSAGEALAQSLKAMALICGWVVLFRIGIGFAQRWFLWIFPPEVTAAVSGLLELSNGCSELGNISDIRLRFLLGSMMLSFGGICVTMQTASVTQGLSLGSYLRGKLLQTLFSGMLAAGLLFSAGWCILPAGIVLFLPGILKKRSGKSVLSGV